MTDADCVIQGCGQRQKARGWCRSHYERWQRHGDPTAGRQRMYGDPSDRFWSRIQQAGECWTWTGDRLPKGYGRFKVDGRDLYAHRWIYEYMVAEIPDGLVLDHLCRNPPCVNPWHLEPVTTLVNNLRGIEARLSEGVPA